jgi:hypothetical protein
MVSLMACILTLQTGVLLIEAAFFFILFISVAKVQNLG